jgi:hypothetical protein
LGSIGRWRRSERAINFRRPGRKEISILSGAEYGIKEFATASTPASRQRNFALRGHG